MTTPMPSSGSLQCPRMRKAAIDAANITDPVQETCSLCTEQVCQISGSNRERLFSVLPAEQDSTQIPDIFKLACTHYFHVPCYTRFVDFNKEDGKQPLCPNCQQATDTKDVVLIQGGLFNQLRVAHSNSNTQPLTDNPPPLLPSHNVPDSTQGVSGAGEATPEGIQFPKNVDEGIAIMREIGVVLLATTCVLVVAAALKTWSALKAFFIWLNEPQEVAHRNETL